MISDSFLRAGLRRNTALLCGILWLAGSTAVAIAQWSPVADGIDYREYTLDGPVRVFVARADRQVKTWIIDTMTSLGEVKGGHETVPDMVRRYDDSITFDGHAYDIKVAINGDYYNGRTGVALSGQIISGWFAKRFGDYSGSGFVWTTDRRCFLGGDVRSTPQYQHLRFADGAEMKINFLNEPRGQDGLALYTPQYAADTGTSPDGVEVCVRVDAPVGIMPPAPGSPGRIVQIRRDAGSTPLFFDTIVLSASGTAATELLQHARVGDALHVRLELMDFGIEGIGLPPGDWRNAWASIGGPKCIVVNGKVPRNWEAKAARYAAEGKRHGSVVKDPRTAIAFNDRYVYFLVIDGRWRQSIGMTFTEAGNFCRDELQATDAVLQDGGGSSTLWLDGRVKNHVSGKPGQDEPGVLRPVANGCFIAQVLPPRRSRRLQTGQTLTLPADEPLRLGPGGKNAGNARAAAGRSARIIDHPLNGIAARGSFWWYCSTDAGAGWLPLEQLEGPATRAAR